MYNTFFILSQIILLLAFLISDMQEYFCFQQGKSRFSAQLIIFSTLLHILNMAILIGATVWFQDVALPEWLKPYFIISYVSNLLNIVMVSHHPAYSKSKEQLSLVRYCVHGLIIFNAFLAFCKVAGLF